MQSPTEKSWTAAELAARWGYHQSSIARVMRRFGFSGIKFGPTLQAARRFADSDVRSVEKIAALHTSEIAIPTHQTSKTFSALQGSALEKRRRRARTLCEARTPTAINTSAGPSNLPGHKARRSKYTNNKT